MNKNFVHFAINEPSCQLSGAYEPFKTSISAVFAILYWQCSKSILVVLFIASLRQFTTSNFKLKLFQLLIFVLHFLLWAKFWDYFMLFYYFCSLFGFCWAILHTKYFCTSFKILARAKFAAFISVFVNFYAMEILCRFSFIKIDLFPKIIFLLFFWISDW